MKEAELKIRKKKKLSKQRKNKLTEENALLKQKYERQVIDYYKLKSEYEDLEIKYQSTVQEKEEIRKTSEAYQMKYKQKKGRFKELIEIYNTVDEKWQESALKYNCLEKDFETHKKKYQRLLDKNTEAEYKIREYIKKECLMFNLRRKVALQQSEIKSSNEMVEEYKSKNLELENKLKECLHTESDLKFMVKTLKKKLEKCESHIDVARQTVDNLLKRRGSRTLKIDQETQESSSSDDSSCDLPEDTATSHDEDNKSMSTAGSHSRSSTPEGEQQNKMLTSSHDTEFDRPKFPYLSEQERKAPTISGEPFKIQFCPLSEKYAKMKLPGDEMCKKRKLDYTGVGNRYGQSNCVLHIPPGVKNKRLLQEEHFRKLLESRQKLLRSQFMKSKH